MAAASFARLAQIHRDFAVTVHAAAGQSVMLKQTQQSIICALACTDRLTLPDIIAAAMHAEYRAHCPQAIFVDIGSHERVPSCYPFTKYLAFLNIALLGHALKFSFQSPHPGALVQFRLAYDVRVLELCPSGILTMRRDAQSLSHVRYRMARLGDLFD